MTARELRLGQAPARMVCNGAPESAARRGTILLYHGFTADSRASLPELQRLADAGFVALGIDAVGHGARRYPDFARRFPERWSEQAAHEFYGVVEQTTAEVPHLVHELVARGWCHDGRLGLAGISMGAFICYGAVLAEPRIEAVVANIGSPRWRLSPERSPHLHPKRFFPVALLSQIAQNDSVVPLGPALELHEQLRPCYRDAPQRLRLVQIPDADHIMPAVDWESVTANMVDWFTRFL